MVDTFYQWFLLFSVSTLLVGFKLGEKVFNYPGVEAVVGVGSPYGRSVSAHIHKIKYIRRIHSEKVGG